MTAIPSDFLTARQTADFLVLSMSSIYKHTSSGRLKRANKGSYGVPALYRRSEVEAFRLRLKRNQRIITLNASQRTCTKCSQCLPRDNFRFYTNQSGNISRQSRCRDCKDDSIKNYRAQNKEQADAYDTNYRRFYRPLTGAIGDGKTSPICRSAGFAIVMTEQGFSSLRAARLDKSLSPGEIALVRYEFHYNVWYVLPVPVRAGDSDRITEWCQRYEARQKAKDGRLKKNRTQINKEAI